MCLVHLRKIAAGRLGDVGLDLFDSRFRFFTAAVSDEPSRTFRNEAPQHQDRKSEGPANSETQPPANIGREKILIEQEGGCQGASGGAEPKAAVDDEVNSSPIFRWDEFIDGGIDGRIFTTDPQAGYHPKEGKTPKVPGKRAQ